jgi:transposase-like protein
MTSPTTNRFSAEVRDRAVRMVLDHEGEHPSRWAAISSIAGKIGCSPHTLLEWVKKADRDSGRSPVACLPPTVRRIMQRTAGQATNHSAEALRCIGFGGQAQQQINEFSGLANKQTTASESFNGIDGGDANAGDRTDH